MPPVINSVSACRNRLRVSASRSMLPLKPLTKQSKTLVSRSVKDTPAKSVPSDERTGTPPTLPKNPKPPKNPHPLAKRGQNLQAYDYK